jgi:hypothetical protein
MALQDLYDLYQPQDIEDQSWLSAMANSAWFAPIKFLGESLGKPQQALYGLLEGDLSALANLIPLSDTFGITSHVPGQGLIQTKQRSGRDLLRNWGIVGPEDTWGNFAAGLTMDILTDPLNLVTGPAGALTKGVKGGLAAEKAGTLLPRIGERIAAGQGGLFGVKSLPWYVEALTGAKANVLPLGTGKIGQSIGTWLGNLSDWATVARIPGTEIQPWAYVKSMFTPGVGHSGTGEYQLVAEKNRQISEQMLVDSMRAGKPIIDTESQALNLLQQHGFTGQEAVRLSNQAIRSAAETGSPILPTGILDPTFEASLRSTAQKAAVDARNYFDPEYVDFVRHGGKLEHHGGYTEYFPRRQADTGNQLKGQQMAREDLYRQLPGGATDVERYMTSPQFSGIARVGGTDPAALAANIQANAKHLLSSTQDDVEKAIRSGQIQGKHLQDALDFVMDTGGVATKWSYDFAKHLSQADPAIVKRGYFYGQSPSVDVIRYAQNIAGKQKPVLNNILDTLKEYSGDLAAQRALPGDTAKYMSLADALKELGMETGASELSRRIGGNVPLEQMGVKSSIVKGMGKELKAAYQDVADPNLFDKMSTWFRYGVTVPWIANLSRNWTDATLNTGLAGTNPARNLASSAAYSSGRLADAAKLGPMQKVFEEAVVHGVVGDQLGDLIGKGMKRTGEIGYNIAPIQSDKSLAKTFADQIKLTAPGKMGQEARRSVGILPLSEMYPTSKAAKYLGGAADMGRGYLRMMEEAQHYQNQVSRLAQFKSLIDDGWSPVAAAKRVKTTHLDYSNLTEWERKWGRNIIPFYSFTKANMRRIGDQFSRDPGPITSLIKVANSGRQDDSFVPSYVSSGAAVPLPGADPGQQRFLASFGLSIEDEMVGALAALGAGSPREAIRRAASSSNPLIKTIYEMSTGTQLFSGRKLEDLKPSGLMSAIGVPDDVSKFISQAVQATPASRVFSTADRLAEADKKGLLTNFLNLLTGARVVDVDQATATSIAARQAIEKMLNKSPYYRTKPQIVMESQYKGMEDQIPPEMLQLMKAYRAMQEKARIAVKEKYQAR